MFAVLLFVFPFLAGEYYSSILLVAGIYVILAVSLDVVVGYTGLISLGHAAFFAIGAYSSGILTAKYGLPPIIGMGAGIIIGGLVAWFIGYSVLALQGYYLAMATLALSAIGYTLIISLDITGGATGIRDIPPFCLFGISFDNVIHYYYLVWGVALCIIYACLNVVGSPIGKILAAIHDDEEAAGTLAINCPKYKRSIFVLSAAFAVIAGSLYSHYMAFLAPDDFNIFTSIHIVIMIFLGGAGTILGPAVGAIFLKLLPEITYFFHDYELLVNGLILILVLVFMPEGLYGIPGITKRILAKVFTSEVEVSS
jgi:branched-chain amino acid transport system permease protein